MKSNYLAVLAIATLLTVGCTREVASNQLNVQTDAATPLSSPVAASVELGTFKAGEHPTKGVVRVVTDNGKRYLEFDGTFKTDSGPDLFVILHRSDAPPIYGIKEQDYVSLGRLQKVNGTQRYALPAKVGLAEFRSVAIWCRQFNATFGFAPLST